MIASRAFSVKTKLHWRKLTWEEVRQVLRMGFIEWQTLPDSILTDNEMGLGGNPNDPFPSWLSLYLAGLGIKHNFIRSHQPTDQPQIERNHRTLDGFTDDEYSRQDLTSFQQALDQERYLYNYQFPSRASDCNGLPPLQAHPALLRPRRPYQPEWEVVLFDLQRVYDFLATFTFERKVNRNGQVTLKGHHYTVGLAHKDKTIQVRLDANTQEWVFLERDAQGQEQELSRRSLVPLESPEDLQSRIPQNGFAYLYEIDPFFVPHPDFKVTQEAKTTDGAGDFLLAFGECSFGEFDGAVYGKEGYEKLTSKAEQFEKFLRDKGEQIAVRPWHFEIDPYRRHRAFTWKGEIG